MRVDWWILVALGSWMSCAGCGGSRLAISDEWRQVATTAGRLEGLSFERGALALEWWRSGDGGWSLSRAPLESAIEALGANREVVIYQEAEQAMPIWARVELGTTSHAYVSGSDPEAGVRVRRYSLSDDHFIAFARCGLAANYVSVGAASASGFAAAVTMDGCGEPWICTGGGVRLLMFSADGARAVGCTAARTTRPLVHPSLERFLDGTEVHDFDDATPALGSFGATSDRAKVLWVPTSKRLAVLVGEPKDPAGWFYEYEERELLGDGGVVRRPTRFSSEPLGRLALVKAFPDQSFVYVQRVAVLGDSPTEYFRYVHELADGGALVREVDATHMLAGPWIAPWGDGGVMLAGRAREDGGFSLWAATMP